MSLLHESVFSVWYIVVVAAATSRRRPEQHLQPHIITEQIFVCVFRVNGVVQNMPEFAEAFDCPGDSKLNPSKKCVLW